MNEELEEIRAEITLCQKVLNSLVDNEGFEILVREQQELIKTLDAQWQTINLIDDKSKNRFLELKYAKLAAQSIVLSLDSYRERLSMALESKDDIDNSDKDLEDIE